MGFLCCLTQPLHASNFPLLPISELHVHADGGIMTRQLFDHLAMKNKRNLKSKDFFKDGIIAHKPGDFIDFLEVYDKVTSLIQTPDDITLVIYDYLKRSAKEGVIYTELMISPEHYAGNAPVYQANSPHDSQSPIMREQGISYLRVIEAVSQGIDKANKAFGIEARILVVLLRHNGPKAAQHLLQKVIDNPHPYVVGINLAGDDVNYPADLFQSVYELARKNGLKLSAHMGEHEGIEDIKLAMAMKLDRVGHGLSVIDDKEVMKQFKRSGIGIEVCPSSNMDDGYGKFNTLAIHPLKTMLQEGLYVALSSDDPAFQHTSISLEYKKVQEAYNLSQQDMIQLCRNSISMSFAPPVLKKKLLKKIADYEKKTFPEQAGERNSFE